MQYELVMLVSFISKEIRRLFDSCVRIQRACEGGVIMKAKLQPLDSV